MFAKNLQASKTGLFTVTKCGKLLYWRLTKDFIKKNLLRNSFLLHTKLSTPQKTMRFEWQSQKTVKFKGFLCFVRNCKLQSVFYVYLCLGLDVTRCNNAQTVNYLRNTDDNRKPSPNGRCEGTKYSFLRNHKVWGRIWVIGSNSSRIMKHGGRAWMKKFKLISKIYKFIENVSKRCPQNNFFIHSASSLMNQFEILETFVDSGSPFTETMNQHWP